MMSLKGHGEGVRRERVRIATLVLCLCFVLTVLPYASMSAQAGHHGGGGPPPKSYFKANVEDCAGGLGSLYVYNVDDNLDGVLDRTVYFYETQVLYGPELGDFGANWQVTTPNRAILQWWISFYGYVAYRYCSPDILGVGSYWQVVVQPTSIYQNYFKPFIAYHTRITIMAGQSVTATCYAGACPVPSWTMPAWRWYAAAGTWYPYALNNLAPWYDLRDWNWYTSDFATDIKKLGHPNEEPADYLFGTATVPYNWYGTAECAGTVPSYPHVTLSFLDASGIVHDSINRPAMIDGMCWVPRQAGYSQ